MTLSLLLFLLASPTQAVSFTATYHEIGRPQSPALFHLRLEEQIQAGETRIKGVTTSAEEGSAGKVVVREETLVSAGKLVSYALEQLQTGEHGSLRVQDGKLEFAWTRDGNTETETEDLDTGKPLLTASTIVPYICSQWSRLVQGEDLAVRFAVLDRKETVGFKFFRVTAKELGQDVPPDRVVIRMKPTSLIIAALVKPIHFFFDKEGSKLLELEGRLPPKRKIDGKWRESDYRAFYRYDEIKSAARN